MKTNRISFVLTALLLSTFTSQLSTWAQGTAFTYQGRLNDGENPATGIYDLRFTIFDSTNLPGTVIAGPLTNSVTAVTNGLFTVPLDFGPGVFTGADRWLEISVRTNGGSGFSPLSPRQKITAAPYAISAGNLSGGLRVELNPDGAPNLIGGSPGNQVDAGIEGATIAGGGTLNYGGSPYTNRVSGNFGVIGGGLGNLVQSFGSFVGGGYGNTVEIGGYYCVIGGGSANMMLAGAFDSVIAGGVGNAIQSSVGYASIGGGYFNTNASSYSVIAGGQNNTVEPFTAASSIGGGWLNFIQSGADQSVIAGGNAGRIQSGARESFIGGGFANTIQTNSPNGFIGGGTGNLIGTNSSISTIAGGQNNFIQPNAQYATIGGGVANSASFLSTVGGGQGNVIAANSGFGTIGGGVGNGIGTSVQYGTIGGGNLNQISQFAHDSTIAGGWGNSILFNVQVGAIGGGQGNVIRNGGDNASIGGGLFNTNGGWISVIGGGERNSIEPLTDRSVISGGGNNRIIGSQLLSVYATISGGQFNLTQTNSIYPTIGGGLGNTIQSNALYATIPGGLSNTVAGAYSFAAGNRARAVHDGAFVWADANGVNFSSSASNQFLIRAGGGVGIGTAAPQQQLSVAAGMNVDQNDSNSGTVANTLRFGYASGETIGSKRTPGGNQYGLDFYTASLNRMVILNTGNVGIGTNNPQQALHVVGNILATGTITGTSDRGMKENFAPVNPRDVLDKVARLPISRWNYKTETDVTHLGPMAQDFYSAFTVGMDDKHISMVDADGVALAAIQGLNQKLMDELKRRDSENGELKHRLEALEKLIRDQKSN